tara:strand:+ start:717 stop:1733 length:1017 start_codon:yes stop_codon:yes gene_type:complete
MLVEINSIKTLKKKANVPEKEHPVKIQTPLDFIINALKGVLMGIADIVPGVSGGTIALVMGIYDQLIITITRVDTHLLKLVGKRQIANAATHLNLPFIISLVPGILTGILLMSAIASSLLEGDTSSQFTFAAFFGMIVASAYLVIEMIEAKTRRSKVIVLLCIALGLLGALAINQIQAGNNSAATTTPSRIYIFLCATIAICAMILPGISGSMILMILGVYHHLVKLPKKILDAGEQSSAMIELGIFICGALFGLMLFSRILKWLLTHYRHPLLATLTGVMLGALPVLFNAAFQRKTLQETDGVVQFGLVGSVILAALIMFMITRKATTLTGGKNTNQ